MSIWRGLVSNKKFLYLLLLLLFPPTLHASFIESTMGTAVVNDATATYYNPAALTLLKNPQFITLGSMSYLRTHFSGQSIQIPTGFTQSGSSSAQSQNFLPALYLGIPITKKATVGVAVVTNFINRDIDGNSILRYAQSSNSIQDIDLVPAIGFKLNNFFSLGAGLNFSYATFMLQPTSGFPSLNIPDSLSRNNSSGTGLGGSVGFLLTPSPATVIGFNYRTRITYPLSGTSVLEGNPGITSHNYYYTFWTPGRSVLSINHFVTRKLGFIGTVQRIQWSVFNEINTHGIATQIGGQPIIVNANVPYHLRDTWLFTVGTHYRVTPKWIVRVAGGYNQSAGNGNYQISNGDSIIIGGSTGYEVFKNIIIDAGYAHVFIKDENINITTRTNKIIGKNGGALNAFSLKLTVNV